MRCKISFTWNHSLNLLAENVIVRVCHCIYAYLSTEPLGAVPPIQLPPTRRFAIEVHWIISLEMMRSNNSSEHSKHMYRVNTALEHAVGISNISCFSHTG